MFDVWIYTIISVIVISLIPLIGVAVFFFKNQKPRFIFGLVSLAVGALFGDVFIHLLPKIFKESINVVFSSLYIIIGILLFFALEKFLHWRHEHISRHDSSCIGSDCKKILPVGYISLISDGLHNFIDGIIVAVSYLISFEVGIATTMAVILHEIPQEIGDIGILLHAGFSKLNALLFNLLSGVLAILGALATLTFAGATESFIPIVLPLAAGGFIYIAGSDLVPELHKTTDGKQSLIQFIAIILGVGLMLLLLLLE